MAEELCLLSRQSNLCAKNHSSYPARRNHLTCIELFKLYIMITIYSQRPCLLFKLARVQARPTANIWPAIIWFLYGKPMGNHPCEKFPLENYNGELSLGTEHGTWRRSTPSIVFWKILFGSKLSHFTHFRITLTQGSVHLFGYGGGGQDQEKISDYK